MWEGELATGVSDQRQCYEITDGDRSLVRGHVEKFMEEREGA